MNVLELLSSYPTPEALKEKAGLLRSGAVERFGERTADRLAEADYVDGSTIAQVAACVALRARLKDLADRFEQDRGNPQYSARYPDKAVEQLLSFTTQLIAADLSRLDAALTLAANARAIDLEKEPRNIAVFSNWISLAETLAGQSKEALAAVTQQLAILSRLIIHS
ncbi:MAG: hypothetical protein AB7W16_06875 [Candidatus Obscuribacterales bacterium]